MNNNNAHIRNLPNLLEIQRSSFCWFLEKGLAYELTEFSSLMDLNQRVELKMYSQSYKLRKPKVNIFNAKKQKITYGLHLYVYLQVIYHDEALLLQATKKNKRLQVLIAEIPLMTKKGSFIINGNERVVVNQLVRSPGIYYKKIQKRYLLYSGTVISHRGAWISFELSDTKIGRVNYKIMWVMINKGFKIPLNIFFQALNLKPEEIYQSVKNPDFLMLILDNCLLKINTDLMKEKKPYSFQSSVVEVTDVLKARELIDFRILNPKYYDLGEVGRVRLNKKLDLDLPLTTRNLTLLDILKSIDYVMDLHFYNGEGEVDDIDSLTNRRVRCVGELLQIQIRSGLNRVEKNMHRKVHNMLDPTLLTLRPSTLFNSKPLIGIIKEFFGSSQLSQYMDETNPLAELTHKRRISALGPGGLSSDHVSFAARDIHPTQYGRLCPIETPEGKNAGLVGSLASHAKLNKYGFIETPFFYVEKGMVLKDKTPLYLDAEKERLYKIAAADIKLTPTNFIQKKIVPVRYNQEFTLAPFYEVNLVAISPIQIISTGASLIPFLEHDDANRALMGSNMQRQAVPLLYPQRPIVGTGLEPHIAMDSHAGVINLKKGKVSFASSTQIVVKSLIKTKKRGNFQEKRSYKLEKYRRSNQDTCVNQKPIVWPGQVVKAGQLLSDGTATKKGELSLGQNLTVAYMPWEGYNYEDAIVVSERLLSYDLFTSVHIEKYEIEVCETKAGPETMTFKIPFVSKSAIENLDKNGLVKKGTLVQPGDILVGKVTPKGEVDLLPEGRLLKAIFGNKIPDVKDTSLRVPKGVYAHVIDVLVFSREKDDNVPLGSSHVVRVFVAEIRKLKIGDKMAGRHGNKGIVSKIMPLIDMPYLPDGTIVDLILNPLGVPSRMNVGQIFESLLGFAGAELNQRFKILPFDEMHGLEASRILINTKLQEAALKTKKPWLFHSLCPGKVILQDGRSGDIFDNPVLVGKSYILKLIHLVEDKIHARASGPYSLITQQPVGGKSLNGGQRFGEMEVWALEAFGAAYTLRELLTVKSDDIEGRNEAFTAIIKGQVIPQPGIPESFKVLLRELQSLGLDIVTYKIKKVETGQIKALEVDLMTEILPN